MKDRIDSMTIEELKAATRELIAAANLPLGCSSSAGLRKALAAFNPTPLDELREWLEAKGWRRNNFKWAEVAVALLQYGDQNNYTTERWVRDAK